MYQMVSPLSPPLHIIDDHHVEILFESILSETLYHCSNLLLLSNMLLHREQEWGSGGSTRLPPECDPGLSPGLHVRCGSSLLLVVILAPRDFSPGTLVFPVLKNQHDP